MNTSTPVIIEGFCSTFRGNKNIKMPGCFKNGVQATPLHFTFDHKRGSSAGHITDLREKEGGLYVIAEVTGGRDALVGYDGLSISMAVIDEHMHNGVRIIDKIHLMGIAIVKQCVRKGVPKSVPCKGFLVTGEVKIEQADLFGEVA